MICKEVNTDKHVLLNFTSQYFITLIHLIICNHINIFYSLYPLHLLFIFGLSHDPEAVPTILVLWLKITVKLKHVAS